jgi:signal peptidase II
LTEDKNRNIKQIVLDYLYLLSVSGGIIALDQWTKALVRAHIPLGADWLPEQLAWLLPYARLRHWYNTGAAFGFFQDGNLLFTILAIIVAGVILYYFPRLESREWWVRLALAMQFSGAVGNLIDRLQFQHVTDFISVGNFPIFNVADSSITVGVAILAVGVLWKEWQSKKMAGQKDETGE